MVDSSYVFVWWNCSVDHTNGSVDTLCHFYSTMRSINYSVYVVLLIEGSIDSMREVHLQTTLIYRTVALDCQKHFLLRPCLWWLPPDGPLLLTEWYILQCCEYWHRYVSLIYTPDHDIIIQEFIASESAGSLLYQRRKARKIMRDAFYKLLLNCNYRFVNNARSLRLQITIFRYGKL